MMMILMLLVMVVVLMVIELEARNPKISTLFPTNP